MPEIQAKDIGVIAIYGSSLSPYVRKVLVLAAEMGIAVANTPTPPRSMDEEFREASPFGKIPALRDGDFTLCDSSAISAYLDALNPGSGLFPVASRARGKVVWFDEFADTIMGDAVLGMFFNRIVGPTFMGEAGDPQAADHAEKVLLPAVLAYLDSVMPASGFLVEDRLTLADIAVASMLVNLKHLEIAIDPVAYPRAARFAETMHARLSFASLIGKESAFLARFA